MAWRAAVPTGTKYACEVKRALPLVILLAAQASALLWEAWRLGVTADEPSHLTASYMYWLGRDVLYPSDTPPLMRMLVGWVPRALGAPSPLDDLQWSSRNSYDLAPRVLYSQGAAKARRLMFLARLPFILFPLLITLVVWAWGRALFGDGIALALAACTALEPTLLGHGALIKSDVMATWGCLLFTWTAWRYWCTPGRLRLAIMTGALVLAVLTKFTLLALIPVALLVVLWRGPRLAGPILLAAAIYIGILAAYQLRTGPLDTSYWEPPLDSFVGRGELRLVRILSHVPWPTQFVRGLRFIGAASRNQSFSAYLFGQRIQGSAPMYFPAALALKFPVPLQILALAGIAAMVSQAFRRRTTSASVFICGVALLLFGLAVRSHLHIGFRHILPILPLLILIGGFALHQWGRGRLGRLAAAGLLLWLAVSSLRIYPQGISYFNEWAGGPGNGWKYLADSNLDWGQNLPELAGYVAEHKLASVKLYYFGADMPEYRMRAGTFTEEVGPWNPTLTTARRLQPTPGVYAVSVNLVLGFVLPPGYQDYFAYFRERQPVGRAGYSIFIYRVPG
ncbi:MAG: hypothetical protein LAP38_18740 [Acidobacteriia bacterium]|nr:hypothetical protein [Terriglobia bacterium]